MDNAYINSKRCSDLYDNEFPNTKINTINTNTNNNIKTENMWNSLSKGYPFSNKFNLLFNKNIYSKEKERKPNGLTPFMNSVNSKSIPMDQEDLDISFKISPCDLDEDASISAIPASEANVHLVLSVESFKRIEWLFEKHMDSRSCNVLIHLIQCLLVDSVLKKSIETTSTYRRHSNDSVPQSLTMDAYEYYCAQLNQLINLPRPPSYIHSIYPSPSHPDLHSGYALIGGSSKRQSSCGQSWCYGAWITFKQLQLCLELDTTLILPKPNSKEVYLYEAQHSNKNLYTPFANDAKSNITSKPSATLSVDEYRQLLISRTIIDENNLKSVCESVSNYGKLSHSKPMPWQSMHLDSTKLEGNKAINRMQVLLNATLSQSHAMDVDSRSAIATPNTQAIDDIFVRIEKRQRDKELGLGVDMNDGMELDVEIGAGDQLSAAQKTILINCRKKKVSNEEKRIIHSYFNGPSNYSIIIETYDIPITRTHMKCLMPNAWLNDEIINYYMAMLQARDLAKYNKRMELSSSSGVKPKKSHFFNNFFVNKLMDNETRSYVYANVRRWTRKFNIFEMDKVFCPVNVHNTHWTMAVIDVTAKTITYYDSMGGSGKRYVDGLYRYLQDEHENKLNSKLPDISEWKCRYGNSNNCPQQNNGVDCGVFSLCCADYISDNLPLTYTQQDITSFWRIKIANDILRGKLDYDIV